MRILNFVGESAADRYAILYDGLVNTGYGFTTAETRVHSTILGKFESIGKVAERGGTITFSLDGASYSQLSFDEAEFKLMEAALAEVRWNGKVTRIVAGVMDFLGEAKEK